jgi:hypothetical protein
LHAEHQTDGAGGGDRNRTNESVMAGHVLLTSRRGGMRGRLARETGIGT